MSNDPNCPACGTAMTRDVRPTALAYKGEVITVDLPGWYCVCGESSHTGEDMLVSDRALTVLKARAAEG